MPQKFRFVSGSEDYRPMKVREDMPWWCSGYDSEGKAVIVAYRETQQDLFHDWPEAQDIEYLGECMITFSGRFPKPEWFKPKQEVGGKNP